VATVLKLAEKQLRFWLGKLSFKNFTCSPVVDGSSDELILTFIEQVNLKSPAQLPAVHLLTSRHLVNNL
jgi:hypothetical protein